MSNKQTWAPGPWKTEPDKIQWKDNATGYSCLIVRNGMGALCGYAAVTEGHPFYKKDYDNLDCNIDVHGGLSYSDFCQEGDNDGQDFNRMICHIPEPGQPDNVWWFGFDCAHSNDHCPASRYKDSWEPGGHYWTVEEVKAEVTSLAAQLHARAA